ncbi:collagen-binding protein [Niabella ginsenosidivorans]|uniref:Collagen-binding protein n=1 Tax=Niabella ginsenosidivorans TaxID=1176587 RepID=A0A1A9HY21_9BACT|nr:TonB-dependent receptor [Niabella ginsenosidivorans]ANH80276.1 collagen-binding protein [Niabella ginsenosidivorans]
MRQVLVFCISLLVAFVVHAQEKYTLSGTIKTAKSGETIIGASILINGKDNGTVSNEYGFYSVTLPKGSYSITYSAVGFESVTENISLNGNKVQDIVLPDQVVSLEDVTVNSAIRGRTISGTQMGVEHLNMKEVNTIPMLLGERDILKAIQLLPGIKSAGDGNSGFYVRGGSTDQNLILLDEANVYNASHLMGFFSTFNSDIVKDVTVYKGGMPAQYGGRLSSVLDVKMNEGNNQDYGVSGGIGLISAKLNVEGPIQKDRSSFLVSGRRSYADLFLPVFGDSTNKGTKLYFYDLNAKMNYVLGAKDRLYLSGYLGRDVLRLEKQFGLDWGNKTATLRWNHIFNERVFSNTSFIYSNFNYNIDIDNPGNHLNIFSQIRDINLKEEIQWYAGPSHALRLGFNSIYHTVTPGEITSTGTTSYNDLILQDRYSWENALFATDTWKLSGRFNLTYGLRLSSFAIIGPGDFYTVDKEGTVTDTLHYKDGQLVKNYWNLEPRLAASFVLNSTSSIKASYARNTQNMHLVSNSATNVPTDKWIASTNIIKPEIADIYSVGWYKNLKGNAYELTIESYYKWMQNQIDYRTGADVYTNDAIESQLLTGIGRAYGMEFLLKKRQGKMTGWIGYTLSKSERKIDGINDGEWYNARQDRTHDVAVVANYQLNKKWNLSANWVYYTGDAVTFPSGKYVVDKQIAFYYTKRNAYRMPAYHRLDLGATMQLKTRRKGFSSELAFSLYNAYGRQNAFVITFQQSEADPDITEIVKTSLFRFVPSVSYHFKF